MNERGLTKLTTTNAMREELNLPEELPQTERLFLTADANKVRLWTDEQRSNGATTAFRWSDINGCFVCLARWTV